MRVLFSFVFPGGVLLLATLGLLWADPGWPWLRQAAAHGPFLVLAVAVLLGWRFNRSRVAFGVLLLVLTARLLQEPAFSGELLFPAGLAVFLAVNVLLLAVYKERGLFTWLGIARLLFIAAQALALVLWVRAGGGNALAALVAARPLFADAGFSLPRPLLAVAIPLSLTAIFLAWRFGRNREPLDQGFFWTLAAAGLALAAGNGRWQAEFLFAVAGLILVVATFESAHRLAFRDELTGLPARRALNEALLRLSGRYVLAMVDIDFFKKFNDRYGHEVGDQVLRMVAARLARVGGGGRAFRYGGEEFAILFSGRDRETVVPHLERLREEVAAAGFTVRGSDRPGRGRKKRVAGRRRGRKRVTLTVSIGAAERLNGKNHARRTLAAADKALYRAKNQGRNRVVA